MPSKIEERELTCSVCGNKQVIKCILSRDYSQWRCRSCAIKAKWADPDYRRRREAKQKARPQKAKKPKRNRKTKTGLTSGSKEYRTHMSNVLSGRRLSNEHKKKCSDALKKKWKDLKYRAKIISALRSQDAVENRRIKSASLWENPEYAGRYRTAEHRNKMSQISKQLWRDPEYRAKVLNSKNTPEFKIKMARIQGNPDYIKKLSIAAANLPRVSNLQTTLYSILDELNVPYFREYENGGCDKECIIGPWSFDCMVPRLDDRDLLIECNGDWVHSLPARRASDLAKRTYIERYWADTYELKTIWEHEFAEHNRVRESIKLWLGIGTLSIMDFDFSDVKIKRCTARDYRQLLTKYHYIHNAGRGGIAFGAFIYEKLIAVCVFSPLPRQNISINKYKADQIRDLSRLCIHPRYQKKNFASWFVSRCLKLLPVKYRLIIAYADSTFNHNGAVYKACNFIQDAESKPEYWYRSPDGWVMHKKTLYNKAINLNMKEKEYADKFNYAKIKGFKKLRFVYERH